MVPSAMARQGTGLEAGVTGGRRSVARTRCRAELESSRWGGRSRKWRAATARSPRHPEVIQRWCGQRLQRHPAALVRFVQFGATAHRVPPAVQQRRGGRGELMGSEGCGGTYFYGPQAIRDTPQQQGRGALVAAISCGDKSRGGTTTQPSASRRFECTKDPCPRGQPPRHGMGKGMGEGAQLYSGVCALGGAMCSATRGVVGRTSRS